MVYGNIISRILVVGVFISTVGFTYGLFGCGVQIDCKRLSQKLEQCGTDVYVVVSGPSVAFVESLTTEKGGLEPQARSAVTQKWHNERKNLASKFVGKLNTKCTRDKGRYREAKDLNRCLNLKDCKKFAACFQQAVKTN